MSKDKQFNEAEWKATASEEAIKQFNASFEWFCENVKCCHNCANWSKDPTLFGDYAYNFCNATEDQMTKWDCYCEKYDGNRTEENLLDFAHINWDEVEP